MRNEELVATRLPKGMLRDLQRIERVEQSDRSSVLRRLLAGAIRAWKLQYHAQQYAEGRMTLARAAKEAGVSVREMGVYLREHKVAAQYDLEDLEQDLRGVYRRLSS